MNNEELVYISEIQKNSSLPIYMVYAYSMVYASRKAEHHYTAEGRIERRQAQH